MKKRQRSLLAGAIALLGVLIACTQLAPGPISPLKLEGRWDVIRIDDRNVSQEGYEVVFENGRIMHGFDGCNHWSRQFYAEKWVIVGTAIGCPQKILQQAYSKATGDDTHMQVSRETNGTLRVTSAGHAMMLTRSVNQEPILR